MHDLNMNYMQTVHMLYAFFRVGRLLGVRRHLGSEPPATGDRAKESREAGLGYSLGELEQGSQGQALACGPLL